jgi:hypothetical protein
LSFSLSASVAIITPGRCKKVTGKWKNAALFSGKRSRQGEVSGPHCR